MNKIMDYRKVRSSLDVVSSVVFKTFFMRIKRTVVVLIINVVIGFLFLSVVLSISFVILLCLWRFLLQLRVCFCLWRV